MCLQAVLTVMSLRLGGIGNLRSQPFLITAVSLGRSAQIAPSGQFYIQWQKEFSPVR